MSFGNMESFLRPQVYNPRFYKRYKQIDDDSKQLEKYLHSVIYGDKKNNESGKCKPVTIDEKKSNESDPLANDSPRAKKRRKFVSFSARSEPKRETLIKDFLKEIKQTKLPSPLSLQFALAFAQRVATAGDPIAEMVAANDVHHVTLGNDIRMSVSSTLALQPSNAHESTQQQTQTEHIIELQEVPLD